MKLLKLYILLGSAMVSHSIGATNYDSTSQLEPYITNITAWRHGKTYANDNKLLSGGDPDDAYGMSSLNLEGYAQAEALGHIVCDSGTLDVIYTSDLQRSSKTAEVVQSMFDKKGFSVGLLPTRQLREILHGRFNMTPADSRNEAAKAKMQGMLDSDLANETAEDELNDKFRFWKVHPLVESVGTVPGEVVNVDEYLASADPRPETQYQLYQRIKKEFIRIAKDNLGKTVGISTHGAVLITLKEALNKKFTGSYLPPHYLDKEVKRGDEIVIPAASKVENCALVHFKYDSRDGSLELVDQF